MLLCALRVDTNSLPASGDRPNQREPILTNTVIVHTCTQVFHPTTHLLSTYTVAAPSQVLVDVTDGEQNGLNSYLIDVYLEECHPITQNPLKF